MNNFALPLEISSKSIRIWKVSVNADIMWGSPAHNDSHSTVRLRSWAYINSFSSNDLEHDLRKWRQSEVLRWTDHGEHCVNRASISSLRSTLHVARLHLALAHRVQWWPWGGRQYLLPLSGSGCDKLLLCVRFQSEVGTKECTLQDPSFLSCQENLKTIRALWNARLTSCCRTGTPAAPAAVGLQTSRLCG